MKVESTFVVEGNIVKEVFRNTEIIIYEGVNKDQIYIVSNNTKCVITKMEIECDMSQSIGYVSETTYTNYSVE